MPSSRQIRSAAFAVLLTAAAAGISEGQQPARSAPAAPTAADWAALAKLPDFTGVWEVGFGAPAGRGAAGGGRGRAGGPPAGPQLTPAYAEKRRARIANPPEDSQAANCLPPGMPGIMGQPYPMEFLLTPGLVTIVIEAYTQVRHIYTDGRPLPADPDPKFHGTSVGHWEGDTLVTETVGFSPQTDLGQATPHSDKMKIIERFKLADPDTMTIETTVVDPEALAAPFTSTRMLKRHRAWTIAEYICEENNRNFVDANGKAGINIKKD
jgi:hypothetical protein